MSDDVQQDALWTILLEIKDDLGKSDEKFDQHIVEAAEDRTHLQFLCTQVGSLNKLVTQGNGQESVLAKLARLEVEVAGVKEDIRENKISLRELVQELLYKNDDEANDHATILAKARWLAIGKIAGLLALTIPGILAFLDVVG
jgi:hypothetical protein